MRSTKIAAVVPFYNRRRAVLAALDSVQSQTLLPAKLIVVDDGSTDGGGEAVLQWIKQLRRSLDCRLVRQANWGVAAARNRGIREAGSIEFVAFLDSDDVWPDDFLKRTEAALSADDSAVAATCDQHIVYFATRHSERNDFSGLGVDPTLCMVNVGANLASATLFRRSAIVARGGFPAISTGEDIALFMPLSLDGSWLHVPGQPVTYRHGLAGQLGDEGNLSQRFHDNFRRWAKIYDAFFTTGEGRSLRGRPECREPMGRIWYKAGKELWLNHAPQEALECFRKSWAWDPWRRRCGYRILRTWIKAIGRRGASFAPEHLGTAAIVRTRIDPAPSR